MVTDVAVDHDSKNQESTAGDFGAPHCSCFFSCSVLVLVLVLEAIEYTHQAHWSASYPEPPRSTIGIAAVLIAIEYEYRPPRRTEYRFAEYEYDEI